jgi:hypothetical protein
MTLVVSFNPVILDAHERFTSALEQQPAAWRVAIGASAVVLAAGTTSG